MARVVISFIIVAVVASWVTFEALRAQEPPQPCVVSILNRTAFVQPDGTWQIDNIPSNMGLVRARMVCQRGGKTLTGESDFFQIIPNVVTHLDVPITVSEDGGDPIPESVEVQSPTTNLTTSTLTAQLTVIAHYPDGTTADVTLREAGTNYNTSNQNIATVSENGLVTAISSGAALIQVANEEVLTTVLFRVVLSADSDSDGMPDDYEIANGLDPNDPIDAIEDPDADTLSNLEEFEAGTNPNKADTDSDNIRDDEEIVAGADGFITNPLLADSDGDQIRDKLEINNETDPNDRLSFDFKKAIDPAFGINTKPDAVALVVNTVVSEGTAQLITTATLKDGFKANLTSKATGTKYLSSDLLIVNFGAEDGKIFAGQNGSVTITVRNSGYEDVVPVTVSTFGPRPLAAIDLPGSGFANNLDVVEDIAYIAYGAGGLQIVHLGNRENTFSFGGSVDTPGNANDVQVRDNIAYVADGASGLQVIDVSVPASPVIIGAVDTPGLAWDVFVPGDGMAYVADGPDGLHVVDISDPEHPAIVGTVDTPGEARGVAVEGIYAVVADGNSTANVKIVDISDPAQPEIVGETSVGAGTSANDVEVQNSWAFIATGNGDGFRTVEFKIPTAPVFRGTETQGNDILNDVAIFGRFGFGADIVRPNGVPIVDIGDPGAPLLRAVMNFITLGDADGHGIDADNTYMYLTACSGSAFATNGTAGNCQLYIGQYFSLSDTFGIPPTISITNPVDGGVIFERGFANVTANANDDVFVNAVNFYIDGEIKFTDFGDPYVFPFLVPEGAATFTFGARAVDLAGNVGTAEDVTVTVEKPAQRIVSVADFGTPANPDLPSANAGQTILLQSDEIGAFSPTSIATFPTINDSGVTGTTNVTVINAAPDGSTAQVVVPTNAATGGVTVTGIAANFALQIVPRITSFSNADFSPGVFISFAGSGFIEGGTTARFGAITVIDPDTGTGTIDVHNINRSLNLNSGLPSGASSFATVITTGGESNAIAVGPGSFTGIVAQAGFGTPADPGAASANVGQNITVFGTELKPNTNVQFSFVNDSGVPGVAGARIHSVNPAGTQALVTVPGGARTGNVAMLGTTGVFPLQIVPRLTSFTNADFRPAGATRHLTLNGSGFVEGDVTIMFGTVPVVDPSATIDNVDVFSGGATLTTLIPGNPGGIVTVVTDGGTSESLTVGPSAFTAIEAVAAFGTPADPDLPSANPGQLFTVTGVGFKSNTNINFAAIDDSGAETEVWARVSSINAAGTSATVVLPTLARSGLVYMPGANSLPLGFEPSVDGLTPHYSTDFEPEAVGAEWSSTSRFTISGPGVPESQVLGQFANSTVNLSLTGLPAHSRVVVAFDLFTIDSWDAAGFGCCGPDYFGFNVSGLPAGEFLHTWPQQGARSDFNRGPDISAVQFNGTSTTYADALYRDVRHEFTHSGETLTISFFGSNLQGVGDEGWALDNVRVFVDDVALTPPDVDDLPFLQAVPRITGTDIADFRPSGASRNLRIFGSGFVEGDMTVHFGDVSVVDPDISFNIMDIFSSGTDMNVVVPRYPGSALRVSTDGGVSNPVNVGPTSFDAVVASASIGTPADSGVSSANAGQLITVTGSGFRANTNVFFPTRDDNGQLNGAWVRVSSVAADGTWATVVVPNGAITGQLTMPGLELPPAQPPVPGGAPAYSTDFEGTEVDDEWNSTTRLSTTGTLIPVTQVLGRFTNSPVTLNLTGLPAHTRVVLAVDLFTFDTWDASGSPDQWGFNVTGRPAPEFLYSFPPDGAPYSFYKSPNVTGEMGGVVATDRLYRDFTYAFAHTGGTLEIAFYGQNLEVVANESWGLDNVRVFVDSGPVSPEPDSDLRLQIVPRLTGIAGNADFRPSGTGRNLDLSGSGFVEGGQTVHFGTTADVVDPDTTFNTMDIFSSGTRFNTVIPANPGAILTVETEGGVSNPLAVSATAFTGIIANAAFGTPADGGEASANVGQLITITGASFGENTNVLFRAHDESTGALGFAAVRISSYNAARTSATVIVPNTAVTGPVQVIGVPETFDLQVVPRLTGHTLSGGFLPSGTGRPLNFFGGGFVEGAQTVHFGAVDVEDPDGTFNTMDIHSSATQFNTVIPNNPGSAVSVTTAGGTSNVLNVAATEFGGIFGSPTMAVALFGTPADPSEPSANVGQILTVTGVNMNSNTRVVFPSVDDLGTASTVAQALTSINADGTEATVVVPTLARTGNVTVTGVAGSHFLQIVPRVTNSSFVFNPGSAFLTRLDGSGFTEADMTLNFGALAIAEISNTSSPVDVFNSGTQVNVTFTAAQVPGEAVTFVTDGGTSNTFHMLQPSVEIRTPGNGYTYAEGMTVAVRADAVDNASVTGITFTVDGAALPATFAGQVFAATVLGTANVFAAGTGTLTGGGTQPPSFSFPAATDQKIRILTAPGVVTGANNVCLFNGADGGQLCGSSPVSTNVASSGGISGIIHGNRTMFLAGVFLSDAAPGAAPARLTVTEHNDLATIPVPSLGQTFFIGDGRTSAGGIQEIVVPDGATRLFLGFVETTNFNTGGGPSSYGDNGGSLTVGVALGTAFPSAMPPLQSVARVSGPPASGAGDVTSAYLFLPLAVGDDEVTVGVSATDGGNTTIGNTITVNIVDPVLSVTAVAATGSPADPGLPSANADQAVVLTANYRAFTSNTAIRVPTVTDAGLPGSANVEVSDVASDGTWAHYTITNTMSTGVHDVVGLLSYTMQVVPKLISFASNSDFVPGVFIQLVGRNFVEGAITVNFGAVPVVDPDINTGTIDVHNSGTLLNLNSGIPGNAGGLVSVTTAGGTSAPLQIGPATFTGIISTAAVGTPADSGLPSANAGHLITIAGSGFRSNTNVRFSTLDDSGLSGAANVRVSSVNVDGTQAVVVVPTAATTGTVRLYGAADMFALQVVPVASFVEILSDFRPGEFLRLAGSGFSEGDVAVSFGSTVVTDPDTGTGVINVHSSGTRLDLDVPANPGSDLTVSTPGGTSNTIIIGPTAFTSIESVAFLGTPADAGTPSANVGHTVTVHGAGFRLNSNLEFPTVDDSGIPGKAFSRVTGVNEDATEATVVVPVNSVLGGVSAVGTPGSRVLQVVPRLTTFEFTNDYLPGQFIRLNGSGFVEGDMTATFGTVNIVDPNAGTDVINVHNLGRSFDMTVPSGADGAVFVTTDSGVSELLNIGPTSFTGVITTAFAGTPADPAQPSANNGHLITITGTGLRTNSNVLFSSVDDNGLPGTISARVEGINVDGTEATVIVPHGSRTGQVTMFGTGGSFNLQIVPRLTFFEFNSDFRPGVFIRLRGSGYTEGALTVNFGAVGVIDPDVGSGVINVHSTGTSVDMDIPSGGGGLVQIVTAGGLSDVLAVGPAAFTGIVATANSGTPADAGAPSANVGQLIALTGAGFTSNTNARFTTTDDNGVQSGVDIRVSGVSADRTEATVVVPFGASTGPVVVYGTTGAFTLQIVPVISTASFTAFTAGTNLRLTGSGFVEGAGTINFGNVAVVDPDSGSTTVNVFSAGTFLDVTIPSNASPAVTVATAGGTSAVRELISDTAGIAPVVNVTSPLNADDVFEGGVMTVTAQASDDVFLVSVTLEVKDPFFETIASFTDNTAPYQFLYFVPAGSPGQLVVDATAIDLAGNMGDAGDIIVNVQLSDISIAGTATIGTPANAALPSANVGQTVTLTGPAGTFTGASVITFPTTDDNGVQGTVAVTVSTAAPDGSSATVVVPNQATTGGVRVSGVVGNFALQVVPVITTFENTDFRPGFNLRLQGSGFIEGAATIDFGSVVVVDPSVNTSVVNVSNLNRTLDVTIPSGADFSVAAVTLGGRSNEVAVGPTAFTGIVAVAGAGTPANGAVPSANVTQSITVTGAGFKANANISFPSRDESGVPGRVAVRVVSVSPDGTSASVIVPNEAVTGAVTVPGAPGSFQLQVVPRITSFLNTDFRPSGSGRDLQLSGSGFAEGNMTVNFGAAQVTDPDNSFNIIDVFSNGTVMNTVIPGGATGLVTVSSLGGTSNAVQVGPASMSNLIGVAQFGTPADAALRSANVGQAITVQGGDLGPNTNVIFQIVDDGGISGTRMVRVSNVNASRTEASVVVPSSAVSGQVSLFGVAGSTFLQVVPRLTSFDNADFRFSGTTRNMRLFGSGFIEGDMTVNYGAVPVDDPDFGSNILDVFSSGTDMTVVIPDIPGGAVTVSTDGGTSNILQIGPTLFAAIESVAAFGVPADPSEPSVNAGFLITITGAGIRTNTNVQYQAIDDQGFPYQPAVRVSYVNVEGTEATVAVPAGAVTGPISLIGAGGTLDLQVVPRLTGFDNADFRPSGTSRNMRLFGSGFIEGQMTVNYGATGVDDPDISSNILDVFSSGTDLTVVIPNSLGGTVTAVTSGGTSNPLQAGPATFTGIVATAATGTPANGGPSANAGHTITITGTGLADNTNVSFPAVDDSGFPYAAIVRVSGVNPAGTQATVVVPHGSRTGSVTVPGATGSATLQVVPVLSSFDNADFVPSGVNRNMQLFGSGFVEGDMTVRYGAVNVPDPDISSNTLDVFSTATSLTVVIPNSPDGLLSIVTDGGTSAGLQVGPATFSGIVSTALYGTPADAGVASANGGHNITVTGTGIRANTNVAFPAVDSNGVAYTDFVRVSNVNATGTSALVTVPHGARTGVATMPGATGANSLQVVPVVTSLSYGNLNPGSNLGIGGSGFVEGSTTVDFGAVEVIDPDLTSATLDVFNSGTGLNVTLIAGIGATFTVRTAGGESNVTDLSMPNVLLTSHRDGAEVIENSTITVSAHAFDNASIQSVELFVGGASQGVDTAAPYQFTVAVPAFVDGGGNTLEVAVQSKDNLSNTSEIVGVTLNIVEPEYAVTSVALFGTPADAGQPSATPGQVITLTGHGFRSTTDIVFPAIDDNGKPGDVTARVASVNIDGTEATVVVPANAVTGELLIAGLLGLPAPIEPDTAGMTAVYTNDFETAAGAQWNTTTRMLTSGTGVPSTQVLGRFSNSSATLSLTGLGAHTRAIVEFDIFALDSLDGGYLGCCSPDQIGFNVAGLPAGEWVYSFSNFAAFPDGSRSYFYRPQDTETQLAGTHTSYPDRVYRDVVHAFEHSGDTLQVTFFGAGLEDITNESWAIDNVRVYIDNVAVPAQPASDAPFLQVVPRLTHFEANSDFITGEFIRFRGSGFIEGASTVNFGAVSVADPDTSPTGFNVWNAGNVLDMFIPASAGGAVTVTTNGGTSNVLNVGPATFTGILATAQFGTPADAGLPSANQGQVITITGTGIRSTTNAIFQQVDDNGVVSTVRSRVFGINAAGTQASAVVPANSVTGPVSLFGATGSVQFQVVPRLTHSEFNNDFIPNAFIRLRGNGFAEGASTVRFGAVAVVDPDTSSNVINVHSGSLALDMNIPLLPGPVVTVETAGGMSNPLNVGPLTFTGVIAANTFGTPADPAKAAANAGQLITITGTGFRSSTNVGFPTVRDDGLPTTDLVRVSGVNIDGTEATVVVPNNATTGRLLMPGAVNQMPDPVEPDIAGLTAFRSYDFEGLSVPSEWSSSTRTTTSGPGVDNTQFLGGFSNSAVTLNLGGLPAPHTRVIVAFDIFTLDSWDGSGFFGGGQDFFGFNVAGRPPNEFRYTYPAHGAHTDFYRNASEADATGQFANTNASFTDRLYRNVVHAFDHTDSSLLLSFFDGGLEGVTNESWGLDNVRIYVDSGAVPAQPASTIPFLQVVPRLTHTEFNSDFTPGSFIRLRGTGLTEGSTNVNLGAVQVVDPDNGTNVINVHSGGLGLDLDVPSGAGSVITVTNAGGVSNPINAGPLTFTDIATAAVSGVPGNPAAPSANAGQTITVVGTGITSSTNVQFTAADDNGVQGVLFRRVSNINPAGTEATVVVPNGAVTGPVKLFGAAGEVQLQVVPFISSFSLFSSGPNVNLRLQGSGFTEGAITVHIGDDDVIDPDGSTTTINVFSTGTFLDVLMPSQGGTVTVTTQGGESNGIKVGLIIPAGQQNLSRLAGVTVTASTTFSGAFVPARVVDGNFATGWFTANFDPAPSLTITLPQDVTVHSLQIVRDTGFGGFDFLSGKFTILDAASNVLFESPVVEFVGGGVQFDLPAPESGARVVQFFGVTWQSIEPGLGEFAVVGTTP